MKKGMLLSGFVLAANIMLIAGPVSANHVQDHYDTYPERLGEVQKDGTVYAGRVQLQDYKEMYISPAAGFKDHVTFDEGQGFCASLQASGHSDWRMADRTEAWQIFWNKKESATLDSATGDFNASSYWVAQPDSVYASPKTEIVETARLSNFYVPGKTPDVSVICVRP